MIQPFYYRNLILLLAITLLSACKGNDSFQKSSIPKTGNPQIDLLTEQIFKNPKNAKLYFERAQLFRKNADLGGFDYAIEDMKYALSLDSTNPTYHHFLADVFMDYRQSRAALNTMQRCADLHPNRIQTLLKLAEFQLLLQQYPESMQTADKILKIDPQSSEGFFIMGMNFKETGKVDEAIKTMQRAADLNAQNKDAFIELGHLFEMKNNPIALKYFENALTIDSLDIPALMAKAVFFHQHNRIEEAINTYKQIIQLDRHQKDVYFNLGLLYFEHDSTERARQHFNIVIAEAPSYVKTDAPTIFKSYYYRGACLEKQGSKEDALIDYKKALSLAPNYALAKAAVGRLSN
jgi:tetratricopeptide (TPR) repeat protein